MPAPSWENLDDFFGGEENGGFSVPAVFTLADGSTRTANVIFDDPKLDAQLGEYIMEESEPRVTGKETDLADVRRGDYCLVVGRTFDVLSSARPDGTGTAMVMLSDPNAEL